MAHRHALPEPLGLSAQSQVPRGTRRGEGGGAGFTARKRGRSTCATVGPRAIFPEGGWLVPLPDSRCAHTDSRTQISKNFEISRRSRVTTRPTTPKPNPNRAGSARARSHAPVCKLWLAWVFVGSKDTVFEIQDEQKREPRVAHAN